jgi:branched-chain amino acid transport system permease protein
MKDVKTYHRNVAIVLGLFLLLLVLLPVFLGDYPYVMNVLILVFYMTTLSMAWNLLGGMTGQNSLGHAAYMGLGAYACCLLMTKTSVNPWICGSVRYGCCRLGRRRCLLSMLYSERSIFHACNDCFR